MRAYTRKCTIYRGNKRKKSTKENVSIQIYLTIVCQSLNLVAAYFCLEGRLKPQTVAFSTRVSILYNVYGNLFVSRFYFMIILVYCFSLSCCCCSFRPLYHTHIHSLSVSLSFLIEVSVSLCFWWFCFVFFNAVRIIEELRLTKCMYCYKERKKK